MNASMTGSIVFVSALSRSNAGTEARIAATMRPAGVPRSMDSAIETSTLPLAGGHRAADFGVLGDVGDPLPVELRPDRDLLALPFRTRRFVRQAAESDGLPNLVHQVAS